MKYENHRTSGEMEIKDGNIIKDDKVFASTLKIDKYNNIFSASSDLWDDNDGENEKSGKKLEFFIRKPFCCKW